MITDYIKYISIFILAIFLQVLIFDNIYLGGHAHIFFYIVFILVLPIEINRYLLMILGFSLGIFIDIFNNTIGIHAFATVSISFLRPYILQIYAPRDGYEPGDKPRISNFGYGWFLKYALTLVLIHNLIFYTLEVFRFYLFFQTLSKAVLSCIISLIIITLSQMLFIKKRS